MFITRMSTCSILDKLCIFKVVQHAEVLTNVNVWYPRSSGFIMELAV
jgi:hypothetical protein